MGTFFKWIAGIIGVVLLLLVIAISCVVIFIKPSDLTKQLSQQVYDRTGRQLIIGNVSWTIYPMIGIKATDISLSDSPTFDNQLFAQAKQADIAAKFASLLNGHLELGDLTIEGLTLNLVKNSKGITNWQDFLNQSNSTADPSSFSGNEIYSIGGKQKLRVSLSGVYLKNATLNWNDRQQNQQLVLNNLQLKIKNLSLNQAFPIELGFSINSNQPQFSGKINVKSNFLFNKDQRLLTLTGAQLNLAYLDNKFPGGEFDAQLISDAKIDLAAQTISLSNMDAAIANMHITGNLQGQPFNKNIQLNGALQIPDFDIKLFLSAMGKSSSSFPHSIKNVSASFHLQASPSTMIFNQLHANLGYTQLNGTVAILNFANPSYHFKLSANNVDLNQFSSSPSSASSDVSNSTATTSSDGLLPISFLKSLNATGELSIDKLTLSKLSINGFYTQLNANNGLVQFNPLRGGIYQGQMSNTILINAQGSQPRYKINANFTGIQIDPLLESLADITRIKVSGSGNLSANVTATGNNSNDIKSSLSGNAKFSINNGIIFGIDIPYYSDVAASLINKKVPSGTNTHQTAFGNLTGTATINNGLVSNNDLLMRAPQLTATGSGTANLVSEQLNYAMTMQRINSGSPQGPEIPLVIKGTFSNPVIQPDITKILESQVTKQLQKQINKQLQNAIGNSPGAQQLQNAIGNGDVGKQIQKGLNSIFGQ